MATPPDFTSGQILTAAQMNSVGLWKVASGTLSLTTTASDVLACFTSDYTNYRLLMNITARSTTSQLNMRYLIGSTSTNVNYFQGGLGSDYGSNATAYFQRTNDGTQLSFDSNTGTASYSMDIMSPQLATATRHYGQTVQSTNPVCYHFGGAQTGLIQHTGFQISCSAGTATLEYQVFGYRK